MIFYKQTTFITLCFLSLNNLSASTIPSRPDLQWANAEYQWVARQHQGKCFVFAPTAAIGKPFSAWQHFALPSRPFKAQWPKLGTQYTSADGAKVLLYLTDDSSPTNTVVRAYENFTLETPGNFGQFNEDLEAAEGAKNLYASAPINGATVISVPLKPERYRFVAVTSATGLGISHIERNLSSKNLRHMIGNIYSDNCRLAAMPVTKIQTEKYLLELNAEGIDINAGRKIGNPGVIIRQNNNPGAGSSLYRLNPRNFFYSWGGERSSDFLFFVYDSESGKTVVVGRFLGGCDIAR